MRSKFRDQQSVLDDFRLSGSSRVLFPHGRRDSLEAVLLNTSGGLTGGDDFHTEITAGKGSHLTVTTQAAERAYRSIDENAAKVRSSISVAPDARLNWLPQETIIFDGANVDRTLDVGLSKDSCFLMVEPMIFGRTAMGETVHQASIKDKINIRRDGRIQFADRVNLSGDIQSHLDRPAIANGNRAMAALLFAANEAERHVDPLRALLPPNCGVSLIREGLIFARLLAEDGHSLRQILIPALRHLRGAELPRTWML
ncbi:urease accessory protein UreD [Shimia isoporae]|uniref:urease accessory protein UreD n=1 Tax=Shimia isoporae TaxID=647720 RepID=UPI0014054484|nr:urease accessory protein UreD [Shimia isoporae]